MGALICRREGAFPGAQPTARRLGAGADGVDGQLEPVATAFARVRRIHPYERSRLTYGGLPRSTRIER
jgi:hypothetical protein